MANNESKPPMTDIVSAARKSIKNDTSNNPSKVAKDESKNTSLNNTASAKTVAKATTHPKAANAQPMNTNSTNNKNTAKSNAAKPSDKDKAVAQKPSPTLQTLEVKSNPQASSYASSKTSSKSSGESSPFNNKYAIHDLTGIVGLLCETINTVHTQTLDFSNQLRQRRLAKEESLSKMQIDALSNMEEMSSAYIDAAKSAIKNKNPIEIFNGQTKVVTEMQKFCSKMLSDASELSMDLLKHSIDFSWSKYSNKK